MWKGLWVLSGVVSGKTSYRNGNEIGSPKGGTGV